MTILSAILLAMAFPKFDLYFLAWFAITPFLLSIENSKSPRSAALHGYIFGLVFLGINLFWLNVLSNYVGFYAILGWISIVLFESAFFALFAYISKKLHLSLTVWQALLWILIEMVRGTGIFGFSCGVLAYSQDNLLSLIQIASKYSVYSISFLIIIANISIARFITKKRWDYLIITFVLIGLSISYGNSVMPHLDSSFRWNDTKKPPRVLTVSIIQGNIPQEQKLTASFNNENFNIHKDLTLQAAADKPDIIIWPETAVFTYLLYDNYYKNQIIELAKTSGSYLLIGTPHYDNKLMFYNSLIAFSPSGEVIGRYDKQHLVPFGEYLPFRALVYPLLKGTNFFSEDFSPGPENKPLKAAGANIGAVICFESTFPEIVREKAKDSDILLVVTNDGWFKNTSAAYEHFDQAILRAIENRKYFIQVGNTGISALIDPYGRVIKKLDLNKRGFLTFRIPIG